ncbi:FKBP-type peptidyl-prolyl cis-trans isomerase [Kribbia dieselivorans]|uniref:FKBP-type peptidyl-prolyl cis-trans isomerase n=1 Tax=Kribbia dieselivorans TaxID=331526 RepID=UPI000838B54C|nr:FKBP-type peptidyl-prolyl cis-trans isomerase [Kribbia dieselivorans]
MSVRLSRSARIAALATAAALTMAACGGGSGSTSGDGALKSVTVEGGNDQQAPTVTIADQPLKVDETTTSALTAGDGQSSTDKTWVSVDYVLLNGRDGKVLEETYKGDPVPFDLSSSQLIPGIKKSLTGQKADSRVISAVPPKDAFGDQGNASAGVEKDDTLVFAFDVRKVLQPLTKAEGETVKPKSGLPKVTQPDGKPATFVMPKGTPPKNTQVQPLIKGDGDKITKGDTVIVNYTGALWKNGKVFDSSLKADRGAFSFQVGAEQAQVIKAWNDDLIGQTVGSRVLLVVPPKDGYGSTGSSDGSIKGTDTIVFSIDILGTI